MLNNLKRWLLSGIRAGAYGAVDEMDKLEPLIEGLIVAHGAKASKAIVDLVQDKIREVLRRILGER